MSRPPLRLFLAGDVMTGRGVDQILAHPGDPELYEGYVHSALDYVALAEVVEGPLPRAVSPSYVWGDLLRALESRRPDLRLVNLETAITTARSFEPKGINYRMHPKNVPVLTAADVDACVLANNHVLDWGREGLIETMSALDAAEIGHAGAGPNAALAARSLALEADGRRVLLLALGCPSSGIPALWQATVDQPGIALLPQDDTQAVASARAAADSRRAGDLLVVSLHWGGNWGYAIPERQSRLARRLIDEAGADVIWGHSSHHPKAVEVHAGRLVVYGCGDLINDYEGIGGHGEYRPSLTLAWMVDFAPADGAVVGLEMVPFRLRKFRLCRATTDEAAWLAERMHRECARFGGAVDLSPHGSLRFRH